jgi:MFS family permease
MCGGSNVINFYFGTMLTQAGITDFKTQLKVNLILGCWTLLFALGGSWFAGRIGRKPLCVVSLGGQTVFLFLFGGLTAIYGHSHNTSGIYGTIAMLFLFYAIHAVGITPLTVLYPPEILSYEIRGKTHVHARKWDASATVTNDFTTGSGMALYTLTTKLLGLITLMVWPFSLQDIGWKTFMWNGALNIIMVIGVIIYWVETKGLTLEEVDEKFDGVKHSDVIDLNQLKDSETSLTGRSGAREKAETLERVTSL